MADSKKTPPVSPSEPSLDEDDAPVSSAPPSSSDADASLVDADAPLPADHAPTSDDDAPIPVTQELTSAFLAKKATQDRIREVVEHRVPRGTQAADVRDLIQKANVRALTAKSLARSVPGMRPWLSRLTQNVVIDHYRGEAKHLAWLNRSVDVQELPPDEAAEGEDVELSSAAPADAAGPVDPIALASPSEPLDVADNDRLNRWLGDNVKTKADRLTLEMLRQKATSKKTNAAVAAEFGMTEAAFDNRLLRFKRQWVPAWKRRESRRTTVLIVLWLMLAVAAAVWWLLQPRQERVEIRPAPDPLVVPAPTATEEPSGRFDQSRPPVPQPEPVGPLPKQ
jgi:DNA-directed RNA polymerase specialized sigma24 family protein